MCAESADTAIPVVPKNDDSRSTFILKWTIFVQKLKFHLTIIEWEVDFQDFSHSSEVERLQGADTDILQSIWVADVWVETADDRVLLAVL